MPGPRVEGRTYSPSAIAPVGGSDAPAIAELVKGGLQLFQLNEEREQKLEQVEAVQARDAMLVKARSDMSKAVLQLEQGQQGVTVASTKTTVLNIAQQYSLNTDAETQELLYSMAGKATGADSAVPTIAESKKNTRELQEEAAKNLREQGEALHLPPGLNNDQLIYEITKINAEKRKLDDLTGENEVIEQQGINKKGKKLELAGSAGAVLTTSLTNLWEDTYHPSKELFNSYNDKQKAEVKTDLNRSYDEAVNVLLSHPQLNGLKKEDILLTIEGATHRKDLIIGMLENQDLADFQTQQVTAANAEANARLKGTPEDQMNMIELQQLSQMPEQVLLRLLADDMVKGKGDPNYTSLQDILSNAMRHAFRKNRDNSGFSGYAPDVKTRSDYAIKLTNVFSHLLAEDNNYTPSTISNGQSEINMIIGIQQDTIENPTRYDTRVWDAILMQAASKEGTILANNPSLSRVKGKFNRQLDVINSALVVSGDKLFRDSGSLLNANKLIVEKGRITAPTNPKYSERLNLYLHARANMENRKFDDVLSEWVVDNPAYFVDGRTNDDVALELDSAANAALDAYLGQSN